MIVLALDTSTRCASAAIMEDGSLRTECIIHKTTMHAATVMPLVDRAVKEADITKTNIDRIGVTVGPGSFTGIRIGLMTAKTIAYALGKPIVGINTLDALAYDIPCWHGLIAVALDARNDRVFGAVYEKREHKVFRVLDYEAVFIDQWLEKIERLNRDVLFTGDAAQVCATRTMDFRCKRMAVPAYAAIPRACAVAAMASFEQPTEPSLLMPFYLQRSQAERSKRKSEHESN